MIHNTNSEIRCKEQNKSQNPDSQVSFSAKLMEKKKDNEMTMMMMITELRTVTTVKKQNTRRINKPWKLTEREKWKKEEG